MENLYRVHENVLCDVGGEVNLKIIHSEAMTDEIEILVILIINYLFLLFLAVVTRNLFLPKVQHFEFYFLLWLLQKMANENCVIFFKKKSLNIS